MPAGREPSTHGPIFCPSGALLCPRFIGEETLVTMGIFTILLLQYVVTERIRKSSLTYSSGVGQCLLADWDSQGLCGKAPSP